MFGESAAAAVGRVNTGGKQPVLLIHGLWLPERSWDAWRGVIEDAGYAALSLPWPSDRPSYAGRETIAGVAEHFASIARALNNRPAIIGHSFGGLIAQILAGRGLAAATVAIAPAPFRGVTPLPFSALRAAWPVLRSPSNARRRVALTGTQFRYAFGNAITSDESNDLFEAFAVPAPGGPVFQAAAANINPWTEARVNTRSPCRGPLLILAGEQDHTVPPRVARAAFKRQTSNSDAVTEYVELPGRAHSLTIDKGWRGVADAALSFIQRYV